MKFPILPAGISVVLGAADGFIASRDVNEWAKSTPTPAPGSAPPLTKGKAIFLQGGAIAVGVLGEFMNWHPDVTESLMFTGAALASRAVAFKMAQGSGTGAVAAQGYMRAVPANLSDFSGVGVGGGAPAAFNYKQRTTRVA